MLIAILCVNNYSALAAVFGWDIPEPHTTQVQPASPQDNHKAEAGENDIPSINTYRRAHTSSSPLSGHLSDSDESAETPKFGADNTVQPSSDVTVITNHGTATVNPAAGKAPGIGPKPPVITPAPEKKPGKPKKPDVPKVPKADTTNESGIPVPPPYRPIVSVTVDNPALTLIKSNTAQLTAKVFPTDTTQSKFIKWTSSDPAVATVDKTGKVTAVEGGTATITAESLNGKTAACTVTVSVPATSIKLDISDTEIEKGDSRTLTAKTEPADATDKVTWSSDHPSVATVDETGKVTAVGPGAVTITAKAGDQTKSCTITVGISIAKITLSNDKITLVKGKTKTLAAAITPADTTEDKTVSWTSSNPLAATVDEAGKVTAVEGGKTIITAKVGRYTAQCDVTVIVPVTGVTVQPSITLEKTTSAALTVKITPDDATDKAVTWTSNNPSAATVDAAGRVTAVEGGKATITVMTHDGNHAASCFVTVIVPAANVSLSAAQITLMPNTSKTLIATITPDDATDKTVTWSSSNPTVVTVDAAGKITAVAASGSATITAKSHDGGHVASCVVTVRGTPSAPQNVKAEMINDTRMKVSWAAPANAGTSPITQYGIVINGSAPTTVASNKYDIAIDCPTNCSSMTVEVYAVNSDGDGNVLKQTYSVGKSSYQKENSRGGYYHFTVVCSLETTPGYWRGNVFYSTGETTRSTISEYEDIGYTYCQTNNGLVRSISEGNAELDALRNASGDRSFSSDSRIYQRATEIANYAIEDEAPTYETVTKYTLTRIS